MQPCQGCHPQKGDCSNFACHPNLRADDGEREKRKKGPKEETNGGLKKTGSVSLEEIIVPEGVTEFIRKAVSRREFLQYTGVAGVGVATFTLLGCGGSSTADSTPRQVYVANALGMIVAEPSRCVGCRRCELACTEYNDGKSMPSISV